jgi:tripeptidyl-peptidase-1
MQQLGWWALLVGAVAAPGAVLAEVEHHRQILEPELCCGWAEVSNSSSSSSSSYSYLPPLPFKFTVRTRGNAAGLAQVRQAALNVSTPTHRDYGKHLTQRTIDAITAPSAADTAAVSAWLSGGHGCVIVRVVRGRVYEVECAEQGGVERLLRTSLRYIRNQHTEQVLARPSDCWVPECVQAVFGLHGLPLPPSSPPAHYSAPLNTSLVTPATILDAYNYSGQVKAAKATPNKQAVVSFGTSTFNQTDLQHFLSRLARPTDGGEAANQVSRFVGKPGATTDGGELEASLDVQYLMGVGRGVPTEFWRFDGEGLCEEFAHWTQHLLLADDPPLVNSVSYGWQGNLTTIGCPPESRAAIEEDFAQLAARGVTVIFASGDHGSGSGGGNGGLCVDSIGNQNGCPAQLTRAPRPTDNTRPAQLIKHAPPN